MLQQMPELNWVDYTLIGVLTLSMIMGLVRGFVREAMSLLTWIAAISIGIIYCESVSEWFSAISMSGVRLLLAFVLLVLSILIIGGIISHFIGKLIKVTGFSFTDRLVGTLFGLGRGAAIIAVIVLVVNSSIVSQQPVWQTSVLAPEFKPAALWVKGKLPEHLINKLHKEDGTSHNESIEIKTESHSYSTP